MSNLEEKLPATMRYIAAEAEHRKTGHPGKGIPSLRAARADLMREHQEILNQQSNRSVGGGGGDVFAMEEQDPTRESRRGYTPARDESAASVEQLCKAFGRSRAEIEERGRFADMDIDGGKAMNPESQAARASAPGLLVRSFHARDVTSPLTNQPTATLTESEESVRRATGIDVATFIARRDSSEAPAARITTREAFGASREGGHTSQLTAEEEAVRRALGFSVEAFIANRDAA